jgi:hypothetical protein
LSCHALGVVLTVAGGVAELAGLGLLVVGIAQDRRKADRLFRRFQTRTLRAQSVDTGPYGLSGLNRESARALGYATDLVQSVERQVRNDLADVLAGNIRERIFGVVLFALGVGLSVAGNLLLS